MKNREEFTLYTLIYKNNYDYPDLHSDDPGLKPWLAFRDKHLNISNFPLRKHFLKPNQTQ